MDHYHNERPALFRYSDSFKYKESQLHLYLEVDKKEKVSGFYYKWDGRPYFLAEFSDYAKKIEGMGWVPWDLGKIGDELGVTGYNQWDSWYSTIK